MSVNGKRDRFTKSDILAVAKQFGIKGATEILARVIDSVSRWPEFADETRVPGELGKQIAQTHRVRL